MHLVQRRQGRDLLPEWPERGGLRPALCLPLLVVLLGEKWLAVDLLGEAYNWIDFRFEDPAVADAAYRLWTAFALLGAALALLWVLRQTWHRIGSATTGDRFLRAALDGSLAIAGAAVVIVALGFAGGGRFGVPGATAGTGLAIAAQLVRPAAEELFFRGLIQRTLVRLLAEAGLGEGRLPRLLAIVSISVGFSLEHIDPSLPLEQNLRALFFVFVVSSALGALLEASTNLYLVMLAHAAFNLGTAGLIPLPVDAEGAALLPPALFGGLVMIGLFVAVTLRHRAQLQRSA